MHLVALVGQPKPHQEHQALACGVGREKSSYGVIEEGHAGCAKSHRVTAQVHTSADDSGLKLRRPVAAVAQPRQNGVEVGHEEGDGAGVCAQRLLETEMAGFLAELPFLKQFECAPSR